MQAPRWPISLCALLTPILICKTAWCGVDEEIERQLTRGREDGSFVVIALTDTATREVSAELLAETDCLGSLGTCRAVHVALEEYPAARLRFGVRQTPTLILLDRKGGELGRCAGQGTREALRSALSNLSESVHRLADCRETLRRDPDNVDALYWLGNWHWAREDVDLAMQCHRRVVELTAEPSRSGYESMAIDACRRLGEQLLEFERFEAAESLLRSIDVERAPPRHADWIALRLAFALERQGKSSAAIETLEARLEKSRNSTHSDRLLFTLAKMQQETGQHVAALRSFKLLSSEYGEGLYGKRAQRVLQNPAETPSAAPVPSKPQSLPDSRIGS